MSVGMKKTNMIEFGTRVATTQIERCDMMNRADQNWPTDEVIEVTDERLIPMRDGETLYEYVVRMTEVR